MISNQSKRYIETKYSEKNAVISRLGVAVSGHLNEGTGSNILRLISISSLTSVKRVHMIIECVSAISKRNPDLKLEWAHYGDGPLKTSLHEFATKSLGDKASLKWAFRGHVTNRVIRNKLCEDRWDAIINLSEYEGIPVSMMEAMSAGIPVIATDVGAVAELVDADYPLLFPVNVRPELVADTVTRHLPFIKCSETRQRCQAKIVESFNESRNYNDLIDSIVMTSCGKRPKGTITE
jgi:glycosyltransferase involved in cell wall biosynthesis